MPTITQKEYRILVERQKKVELELGVLKKVVLDDADEDRIRPARLRKWEKISRDLDHGKGRSFSSTQKMKAWLKSL